MISSFRFDLFTALYRPLEKPHPWPHGITQLQKGNPTKANITPTTDFGMFIIPVSGLGNPLKREPRRPPESSVSGSRSVRASPKRPGTSGTAAPPRGRIEGRPTPPAQAHFPGLKRSRPVGHPCKRIHRFYLSPYPSGFFLSPNLISKVELRKISKTDEMRYPEWIKFPRKY